MRPNKRKTFLSAIGTCILSLLLAAPSKADSANLVEVAYEGTCDISEYLENPLTIFISDQVLLNYEWDEITAKIDSSIEKSNLILLNSCIPMKRVLKRVIAAPDISEILHADIHALHSILKYKYEIDLKNDGPHNGFYGVLFDEALMINGEAHCGRTNIRTLSSFFTVSFECSNDILEHELGHLSGAHHDVGNYRHKQGLEKFVKSYAHGYLCGDRGTVMSYSKQIVPVYSSPNVSYNNEPCGSADKANNAKVLTDYAQSIMNGH
ncbi:hypothetical protein [Vibrio coralliilyticus]|uniref:hypothetical protein n=1 Tax=Vibrio coralliilyticus TaxID=190893 RepID=UPI0017F08BEE|nr:hypothetical protein [Vibrio coralliilyticus]NUW67122.1 hypothetical protein [Vibrio coralliilyticus]